MKIISHRGNLNGSDPDTENSPNQTIKALSLNFEVEVDVWYINKEWYLGHDKPQYKIDISFLENKKLWCHAKNKDALFELNKTNIHHFWHQNDYYTLTSKGVIWTFPNKKVPKNGVALLFNNIEQIPDCKAICVDNPMYYRNILKKLHP